VRVGADPGGTVAAFGTRLKPIVRNFGSTGTLPPVRIRP
jgi:hypothetical protein